MTAKRGELIKSGLSNPPDSAIRKALMRDELARHCRRRTRGTESTTDLIEKLLLALSSATDSLGVLLLQEEIKAIWEEQQHHIPCQRIYTCILSQEAWRKRGFVFLCFDVHVVPHLWSLSTYTSTGIIIMYFMHTCDVCKPASSGCVDDSYCVFLQVYSGYFR